MGPLLVVDNKPAFGQHADLRQLFEKRCIQDIGEIAAVEAFDEGVLIRFARSDEAHNVTQRECAHVISMARSQNPFPLSMRRIRDRLAIAHQSVQGAGHRPSSERRAVTLNVCLIKQLRHDDPNCR